MIDPLAFLEKFLERTVDATQLPAGEELLLGALEKDAYADNKMAQALVEKLRRKKYGHNLPTAFDAEFG